MILKATFINCNKLSKRKGNDYLTYCEDQLKQNSINYKCIAKQKYNEPNQLKIVIHYETTDNLYKSSDSKVED